MRNQYKRQAMIKRLNQIIVTALYLMQTQRLAEAADLLERVAKLLRREAGRNDL